MLWLSDFGTCKFWPSNQRLHMLLLWTTAPPFWTKRMGENKHFREDKCDISGCFFIFLDICSDCPILALTKFQPSNQRLHIPLLWTTAPLFWTNRMGENKLFREDKCYISGCFFIFLDICSDCPILAPVSFDPQTRGYICPYFGQRPHFFERTEWVKIIFFGKINVISRGVFFFFLIYALVVRFCHLQVLTLKPEALTLDNGPTFLN